MNQLDIYYRAFLEYRRLTESDKECARHRNIISHSNPDEDKLESIKFHCVINEDWIDEIEKGLVFVEKAIKEERQFIRNDGEVVPIEKAKHVDKHSVEHLARHSEFISRMPEDGTEDIVPDKLYMLERDSDFAVYENRFLYMLLRYLADFIDMRLSRIIELGNTYRASTQMKKNISLGKRHMTFEAVLSEERRNDPYSVLDDEAQALVHRIEGVEHWVRALLGTPLMEQVAKVPMVRPPITKTNVLRMNNNFKKAVALYEYVTSYEGDGYTVEERKKLFNPFPDIMGDEFSEIVLLTSFLTYEYGSDIKDKLKASYEEEEERRRREEQDKLAAQIGVLKKRIAETGESPEVYMLMLEKRNKSLEADSAALREKTDENQRLCEEVKKLESDCESRDNKISELFLTVSDKNAQIDALNRKYEADMAAQAAEYESKLTAQAQAYKAQLEEQKASFEQEMAATVAEHQARLAETEERYTAQLDDVRRDCAQKTAAKDAELRETKAALESEFRQKATEAQSEAEAKVEEYRAEAQKLSEENTLVKAQLTGLRAQHGLVGDIGDFSSKERFEELEEQLQAFVTLFDDEWKKARKKIRKDILWTIENSDKKKK